MVWRNLQLCKEGCRKDFKDLDRYRKQKSRFHMEV